MLIAHHSYPSLRWQEKQLCFTSSLILGTTSSRETIHTGTQWKWVAETLSRSKSAAVKINIQDLGFGLEDNSFSCSSGIFIQQWRKIIFCHSQVNWWSLKTNIILSKVTKAQKEKCHMFTLCGSLHCTFRFVCLTWSPCRIQEIRKGH